MLEIKPQCTHLIRVSSNAHGKLMNNPNNTHQPSPCESSLNPQPTSAELKGQCANMQKIEQGEESQCTYLELEG